MCKWMFVCVREPFSSLKEPCSIVQFNCSMFLLVFASLWVRGEMKAFHIFVLRVFVILLGPRCVLCVYRLESEWEICNPGAWVQAVDGWWTPPVTGNTVTFALMRITARRRLSYSLPHTKARQNSVYGSTFGWYFSLEGCKCLSVSMWGR